MSAINREQVAHLAELARIEMSDEELARVAGELDLIVESVASVSQAAGDVVGETLTQEEVLSNAPDSQDGKFRVPAILDGE